MVERQGPLPLSRQCELLGLGRAALYYRPVDVGAYQLELMALIDCQYLRTPFYGSRRMAAWLRERGHGANRKRVRRLMRLMGLEASYQRPRTSRPAPEPLIYPYLLRGLSMERVNQVWAADLCYILMARGFLYLVAVMDWVSRSVLAWRLSNLLDASFCVGALEEALGQGHPEIFNTDQGSQFTGDDFTGLLAGHGIALSIIRSFDRARSPATQKSTRLRTSPRTGPRIPPRNMMPTIGPMSGRAIWAGSSKVKVVGRTDCQQYPEPA
jgi:putative transposase